MIDRFALIIGAMKAGTTTIFDHLSQHPHVAGCSPKEPGFFAFDSVYERGRDWYEALFDFDPTQHRWALDASTDYAKFPHCGDVAARLREAKAEFRLIYSLRNPLRRIESHARHVQHKGREVGQIDSARTDHSLDAGISNVSMDICRYAAQLDQYREYFDKGAVFITSMEQLADTADSVMGDICKFLDLDPQLLPQGVEQRNSRNRTWRAREIHPLWRAASSVAPLRAAARAFVPDRLRQRLRMTTRPAVTASGRFALTPSEENSIIECLQPDLRRLRDEYGFDCQAQWGIEL